jgi:hypothetical protein
MQKRKAAVGPIFTASMRPATPPAPGNKIAGDPIKGRLLLGPVFMLEPIA